MSSRIESLESGFSTRQKAAMFCVAAALVNLLYGFTVYIGESSKSPPDTEGYASFRCLMRTAQLIQKNYIDFKKSRPSILLENATAGMIAGLDPYSHYSPPEVMSYTRKLYAAEICGIGAELTKTDDGLEVLVTLENSSAQFAGIKDGDIITKINGVPIQNTDLSRCRDMLIGEKGTVVEVTLRSADGKIKNLPVVRGAAMNEDLFGPYRIDSRIALIRLGHIVQGTATVFQRALEELKQTQCTKLIIDLRGSPGGELSETVKIAGMFLSENTPVVSLYERYQTYPVKYVAEAGGYKDTACQLAVLVDPLTASCAEILTAAIKDNGRGVVIGEPTYGKGLAQKEFSLPNGGAMTLTIADYLTAGGYSVSRRGVEPTFYIPVNPADYAKLVRQRIRYPGEIRPADTDSIEDTVLRRACQYLTHGKN